MPNPRTRAHASPAEGYWPLAIVLAWAVPGLGHWYLGRPGKAAVYGISILGLFLAGLLLGAWRPVNYNDTLLFVGQSLAGAPAFIAGYAGKNLATLQPGEIRPLHAEMATLYTLIAGFLNLLVVIDAFMVANHIPRAAQEEENEREEKEGKAHV
jgi:hypothetical protein